MATIRMRADERQAVSGELDVAALLGHWLNVKSETDYFTRLVVEARDGQVWVEPYGAFAGADIPWGARPVDIFAKSGTLRAIGFQVSFPGDGVETILVSNEKLGILVIQSYTVFRDDSGRQNHFSREFFRRAEA